jgi:hypothetical protein
MTADRHISAAILRGAASALDIAAARKQREQEQAGHGKPNGQAPDAGAAWAEPLDIIGTPELVGWPELTGECLPAPLYRYVMADAERLNVDPCSLAAHVVAACSAISSDAWRVKPKRHDRWTQQPRIWSCIVKDVGARGTDMLRAAFWPVRQREDEQRKQWQQEMAAWLARQNQRKKGEKADDDPKPVCRRITTQDATIEAASAILAGGDEHAKLTLRCDELVGFLGSFGRYSDKGSAARAMWLEGYDGGPQHIDRILRGNVYVPNWSIVVAGNIQPRRLAGMAKDLVDDGLFQRFMTVHTKPAAIGVDDDVPLNESIGRDYRDLHETLAELMPPTAAEGARATAYFDDDARDVRRSFTPLIERLQFDPTLPTIIRETAPKWSGLLARLALIFHLVDLADRRRRRETLAGRDLCQITGPTVTRAATFLRRIALPNLFRLGFETLPEEGAPVAHARWIAGYILAHQSDHITAREIGRAYRPLRGKPLEVDQAIAVLCDASWAIPSEGRHDGARWRVNPAVHVRFAAAAAHEKKRRETVLATIRRQVADL